MTSFLNTATAEQFKLSSLPHLKKWEIPSMPQKYAMRTGRKFKNIGRIYSTGRKRSSHWSILPELNFRELDIEEDAEKIKLDQNYKAFLEDDDIPIESAKHGKDGLKSAPIKITEDSSKRSKAAKAIQAQSFTSKRHGISQRTQNKRHRLSKKRKSQKLKNNEKASELQASNQQFKVKSNEANKGLRPFLGKGPMVNSSEGVKQSTFSTADIRSNVGRMAVQDLHLKPSSSIMQPLAIIKQNFPSENEEKVSKRSIENDLSSNLMNMRRNQIGIGDAIKRARVAINTLQNRKAGFNKPMARQNLMKVISSKGVKTPHANALNAATHGKMQQSNVQESRNQALRLLKNSGLSNKDQVKNGVLGDQPSKEVSGKAKNSLQAKTVAGGSDNNGIKTSNQVSTNKGRQSQPTQAAQISERAKIETPRAEIEKPKEKMKIVPANVARAVAMAMEQLKRDKMWGKVFVHVLPSGKLKVMVQETKKMPEE